MVATTYTYAYDHRLGRETNTTIRTSRFEGTATVPDFTSPAYPYFTDTTIYPDGTSDYRVHTDRRGVRTVSWNSSSPDREEHIAQTYHPTNLAVHVLLSSNLTYRNGHSISLKSWDGNWTRETFLTAYAADGCRRDIAISEASDLPGVITNRLTHCDILGRTTATCLSPSPFPRHRFRFGTIWPRQPLRATATCLSPSPWQSAGDTRAMATPPPRFGKPSDMSAPLLCKR